MTYGEAIATARVSRGMTGAELSRVSGVDPRTIYSIESYGDTPLLRTCIKLADALSMSIDELIGNKHKRPSKVKTPKEWRKEKNMSVEQLSDRSGISIPTIYNSIENPKREPRISTVEACAGALGLGIDEYIGRGV